MYNRSGGGGRQMGHHGVSGAGGLLGTSPNKRQAPMGTGMQRMMGGRSGLLGTAPTENMDNNMYHQEEHQQHGQYNHGYGEDYGGGYDYERDDTSMYRQTNPQQQGMYEQSNARQGGGAIQGNGRTSLLGKGDSGVYQGNNRTSILGKGDSGVYQGNNRTSILGKGDRVVFKGNARTSLMSQGTRRDEIAGQAMQQQQQQQYPHQQQGYYEEQDSAVQDYTYGHGNEDWQSNEDWEYGQDQQTRGDGLLKTPPRQGRQTSIPELGGYNRNHENRNISGGHGNRNISGGQGNRNIGEGSGGRGLLGIGNQEPRVNRAGLLGQPTSGRGRGLLAQQMAMGQMNQGQQQHMIGRQTDLMQKADLQIRMLQEEKREAVRMQQELLQQEQLKLQEQQRAKDLQTLLQNQQRALMLQQKERMGDGLLGDRPGMMQHGRMQGNRGNGGIPSLLETKSGGNFQLGKRPNATMVRAAQVAKRARQESQNNRNRPARNSGRQSPKRGQRDRGSSRRSRFDSSPGSKSRDRKESESQKSTSRGKRRESKESPAIKTTTEVTVTTGDDSLDLNKPIGDTDKKTANNDVVIMEVEDDKQMETSLTVTVSKKGRSVNDSDNKGEPADKKDLEKKYKCNLCEISCYDERSFSRHMNGVKHKKKMEMLSTTTNQTSPIIAARKKAEEHLRQIEAKRAGKTVPQGKALESHCKVCNEMFTGAYKDHKEVPKHKAKEDRRKAGCKVCNVESFITYKDFMKHLESDWHKKKQKQASWPECNICNQTFKSPRKFVLHCKTNHHIENKKKKGVMEEDDFLDIGELVTLDTVGFEEESTDAKKDETFKEPGPMPKKTSIPVKNEQESVMKQEKEEEDALGDYNPNLAVGQKYVVPVSGFFCKLCHKFYNNESAARGTHCQSQSHFEKYQKIVIAKMMNQRTNKEAVSQTVGKQDETTKQQDTDGQSSSTEPGPTPMEADTSTQQTGDLENKNQSAENGEDQSGELKPVVAVDQSTNGEVEDKEEVNADESAVDNSLDLTEEMDTSELEEDNEIQDEVEVGPGLKEGTPRGGRSRRGRRTKRKV